MAPPPPSSTLFPYTTLFRSVGGQPARLRAHHVRRDPPVAAQPSRRGPDQDRVLLGSQSRSGRQHRREARGERDLDRKSTRLNSSHVEISYAVFCLKKKKENK